MGGGKLEQGSGWLLSLDLQGFEDAAWRAFWDLGMIPVSIAVSEVEKGEA